MRHMPFGRWLRQPERRCAKVAPSTGSLETPQNVYLRNKLAKIPRLNKSFKVLCLTQM